MNPFHGLERSRLPVLACILIVVLAFGACNGQDKPPGITMYVPTHTPKQDIAADPGAVATAVIEPETSSQKQSSSPTITPQVGPQAPSRLVTALPPSGSFTPPDINVAVLALQNDSNYTLQIILQGISQPITLPPGGSTERQLAPGSYSLRALIPEYRAEVFNEMVTLENNTRHTLTLQVPESTLAFDNQSEYTIQVVLTDSGTTYTISPRITSTAVPVAPGSYAYQVYAIGVPNLLPLSGEATVEPGEQVTVTLSVEADETASLAFNNLTTYEAVVTLQGGFPPINILAMSLSEPLILPPGNYSYTVVMQGANMEPLIGSATLAAGEAITISLSLSSSPALSQHSPMIGSLQQGIWQSGLAKWAESRQSRGRGIQFSWEKSRGIQ